MMRRHSTGLIALSMLFVAGCRMMAGDQSDVLSRLAGVTARAIVRLSIGSSQGAQPADRPLHRDRVVISRDHAALHDPTTNVIWKCARAAADMAVPSASVRQTSVVHVSAVSGQRVVENQMFVMGEDGFVPENDSVADADGQETPADDDVPSGAVAN